MLDDAVRFMDSWPITDGIIFTNYRGDCKSNYLSVK